jgi:hypothetical protein
VYSAGQVRDLAWTWPFDAVSRLALETRRSNRSLEQQVAGRFSAARSAEVESIAVSQSPERCDRACLEGLIDRRR